MTAVDTIVAVASRPSPVLLGRFSKDLDDMVSLERGAKTFGVTTLSTMTLSILKQTEALEIL